MKGKDGDNMSGLDFERKHAEKRFEGSAGACAARDEKSAGTLGTAGYSGG